ncbi:MAG: CCA tRNA nucleotidyltransferase [Lentisphaeria bacterium]|nr:CCA tRNA nucleotidyltransferase [Lentisphaeria bacterium]
MNKQIQLSDTQFANFRQSAIFQAAEEIFNPVRQAGGEIRLVGGAVRDLLLGRQPRDLDLVTNYIPGELLKIFPAAQQVGAAFGVLLVKSGQYTFEVASCREERTYLDGRHPQSVRYSGDFMLDSRRRDFTVNALLLDPFTGIISDFHDGIYDLNHGIIRTIDMAEARFTEDYLRMLRAVRFAAKYNFIIAPETLSAIQLLASKCKLLAPERVQNELDKMFNSPHADYALRLLEESRLLAVLLPEVAALRQVPQPPKYHPEGDALTHTILMLRHMSMPQGDLAWSVLLHDIGKPPTLARKPDGNFCFYNHENVGGVMAEKILRSLRFSNKSIENITCAIKNHMRFGSVVKMKRATICKLMASENFPMELELHRLDCMSSHKLMGNYLLLLDFLADQGNSPLPPPLLTGRDLIDAGYRPGPQFAIILSRLEEEQLNGKITGRAAALAYIKEHFKNEV